MLARLRALLTKKPVREPLLLSPTQMVDLGLSVPLVPTAPAPAAPVPEFPELVGPTDRFRVQRIANGIVYQAYAGDDGEAAVRAWEAYRASVLPGEFWFFDAHAVTGERGTFTRDA